MKKVFITAAMLVALHAFSQNVGINTTSPAATLDITGKPATTTVLDGLIAPRITTAQLSAKTYTAAQNGALVYVTDTAAGTNQAVNVTTPGYYYFSGTAMQWVALASSSTVNSLEPWYNQATGTAATANNQNIYQTGNVYVGKRPAGANYKFGVYDASGNTNLSMAHIENIAGTGTQYIDFMGNLAAGSYTAMSNSGDQALIFEVGNGGNPYTTSGFVIGPHVNGGGAVPYGMKITQQGFTGINIATPTETFQINGTARLKLPANGTANAIYTTPGGANSLGASIATIPAPTQTFTAANTVVSDTNGVLGYVAGLPQMANAANPNNWSITGNAGTTPGTNFIGTTDDKDLVFKRYNQQAGWIGNLNSNSAFGVGALPMTTTGNFNSAFGNMALSANTTGTYNTALGARALLGNTTGSNNNGVGQNALLLNTTGGYNNAIGQSAMQNSNGNYNTAVGDKALYQITSGDNNTALGASALANLTNGGNNIAIGYRSNVPSSTGSYQLSIGNAIYGLNINDANATNDLVGVQTAAPTETFNVGGTARVNSLPANGTANAIYTQAGGTASATQNQTFTATRTVVADANGVLGSVAGLPPSAGTFASQDLSTNGTTVSATDGILTVSAGPVSGTFGVTYGQVNMALTTGSSWAIISTTGGDNQTTGQNNYWRGTLSTTVSTNVGPYYQASNSGLYRMTVMLNDTRQVYDVVVSWNSQSGTSAPYRFNVYVKQLH